MRNLSVCWNASPLKRVFGKILLSSALAAGIPLFAQIKVISADNLTPFQPRDVGTTSDAKDVRIQLARSAALTSIAIAPGFTDFTAGAISGCVVDGHTVNPGLTACSVEVTFSPKYPGLRTAPLIVTDSNGGKSSIGLTGIGLAPQAALTPGIITTTAGKIVAPGFSGDGGPAKQAEINAPYDVATDAAGNIYFTDQQNSRIRKIDSQGIITTIAGNGTPGFSGDGGLAIGASLSPNGIALDAAGNLYIADTARIRKVDINDIITTFAGTGNPNSALGDGGPATEAGLQCPNHVTADAAGDVYFSDACDHRVRKVDASGIITTVAGTGAAGFGGDGGPAADALLNTPQGIAVDAAGNLYIVDSNNQRVRKVDHATGNITTVAGNGHAGFSGDNGLASSAQLNNPNGVAADAAGNIYIADLTNARIRRVDTNGMIITVAGGGTYPDDGISARSAVISSQSIAVDSTGSLVISDLANSRVRKVDVSQSAVGFTPQAVGTVSTLRRLVVTNTGNQHMNMGALNVTGDFNLLSGDSSYCSTTANVGVGFSCALEFTFAPTDVGPRTGSSTVTDNSLNLPGTTQTIALNGSTPSTTGFFSPARLAFGNQPLGISSPAQTSTLTNIGSTPLIINEAFMSDWVHFGMSNDCPATLAAGASCTFRFRFFPLFPGQYADTLVLVDNAPDSPQTVKMTGTGDDLTTLSFSPTSLTFGNQTVGTTSPVQTITLTNTGGSAVVFYGGIGGSWGTTGFGISSNCPDLAAGAHCTISVTFSPTAPGGYSGAVQIESTAVGNPQYIPLSGTGVTP